MGQILKPDTDGDGVPDKADMRGYVFNDVGIYRGWQADWDGDGLRKERDPDNDNGGSTDGCEDANRNGKKESWETSNFDKSDDGDCSPNIGDMVDVPAGTFQMGCDPAHNSGYPCYASHPSHPYNPDGLMLHTIYLDAYRIDKTEVTNTQYARCEAAGGMYQRLPQRSVICQLPGD